MAHLTKQQKREKRAKRERVEQRSELALSRVAAQLVCPTAACRNLALLCVERHFDLETDIVFSQLAVEMWSNAKEHLRPVADMMGELLVEQQRHQATLKAIWSRLRDFEDKGLHDHLDPLEHYRDLVRTRIAELPAPAGLSNDAWLAERDAAVAAFAERGAYAPGPGFTGEVFSNLPGFTEFPASDEVDDIDDPDHPE